MGRPCDELCVACQPGPLCCLVREVVLPEHGHMPGLMEKPPGSPLCAWRVSAFEL